MLVLRIASLALLAVAVRSSVLPAIQELDPTESSGPPEKLTAAAAVDDDVEKKMESPLEPPSLTSSALELPASTDDEEAKQRHKKSPYIPPSYFPPSPYPVAPGYKPLPPHLRPDCPSPPSSPICIEIRPKGCVTPFIICETPSHGAVQPYAPPQYGYGRADAPITPGQPQMQQGQAMVPGQQGSQTPIMSMIPTGQVQQNQQGRPIQTQQQVKPSQPANPGQGPRSEKYCDSDAEKTKEEPVPPKQVPQHERTFLPYHPHYPLYSPHYHLPPPPAPLPTYVNPPAYVSSPLALSCQLHPHPYPSPSLLQLHLKPDHPAYGSAYRANEVSTTTHAPPTSPKPQVPPQVPSQVVFHDPNVPLPKSDAWEKSEAGCVNPENAPRADAMNDPQGAFGRDVMEETMENQVFVNEVQPMAIL